MGFVQGQAGPSRQPDIDTMKQVDGELACDRTRVSQKARVPQDIVQVQESGCPVPGSRAHHLVRRRRKAASFR